MQDVRALAQARSRHLLPYVAATGEGIYYFIDQFIWCALLAHSATGTYAGDARVALMTGPHSGRLHTCFLFAPLSCMR